jgi:hypothetical protein
MKTEGSSAPPRQSLDLRNADLRPLMLPKDHRGLFVWQSTKIRRKSTPMNPPLERGRMSQTTREVLVLACVPYTLLGRPQGTQDQPTGAGKPFHVLNQSRNPQKMHKLTIIGERGVC